MVETGWARGGESDTTPVFVKVALNWLMDCVIATVFGGVFQSLMARELNTFLCTRLVALGFTSFHLLPLVRAETF